MREPQDHGAKAPAQSDFIQLGPRLALRGSRLRFSRNEEIFGESEPVEYIYRVISGAVRTMRFSSDGKRQILAFHFPGDVFGYEPGDQHHLSAEAVQDAEILLAPRSAVEQAAERDVSAAQALLALTTRELRGAHEHALMLGRKGAGERVAAFLLHLTERTMARHELDLPMSRLDIADFLGLTIETVSRAFTEMERQSVIALPSSRHVVVRSHSTLCQLQAA